MIASCENTCKRVGDHAQVALQSLREYVAHIAYVHVHSHLLMVDTQREHTRSPPLSLAERPPLTSQEESTSSWAVSSLPQWQDLCRKPALDRVHRWELLLTWWKTLLELLCLLWVIDREGVKVP